MEGARLDATSYTTAFRVRLARPEQAAVLEASLPPGLVTAGNLGAADVFPDTSGKAGAAAHLMRRWGLQPDDCVFMCGACVAGFPCASAAGSCCHAVAGWLAGSSWCY